MVLKYWSLAFLLFSSQIVFSQTSRVFVSNDDPKAGEQITIWYTAPDSSAFASKTNSDTLFCVAVVQTQTGDSGIVRAMQRDTGALYHSSLLIPKQASSIRIEICIPEDRVPDGILMFTCRDTKGNHAPGTLLDVTDNTDSALNADVALYPTHYSSYLKAYDIKTGMAREGTIQFSDSARIAFRDSLIARLERSKRRTPAWYFALAGLNARAGRDSVSIGYLREVAAQRDEDPLYQDRSFWNYFFAPSMKAGGKMVFKTIEGRTIAPLVDRFPHTVMAKIWLERSAYDTLVNPVIYRRVANLYASSRDADLLSAIGGGYAYKKSPLYDPAKALIWLGNAELASRSKAGFYNGENMYGSMGRLGRIVSEKVAVLASQGKVDMAVAQARSSLAVETEEYNKEYLRVAIANAYLTGGKLDDAQRAFGVALAHGTRDDMDGLDSLFDKCKQGSETRKEFVKRLIASYGSATDLPFAKNFSYTTVDGKTGSLTAFKGKVVVIDCWFINCPGCILEKKSMNALAESFADNPNVVFLGIARDNASAVKRFLERTPTIIPQVANGDMICNTLGVTGFPTHIILGRDGKTLGWDTGGSETEGEMMRPKIVEALK